MFYGFIITAFIMATLYFVLKSMSQGTVRSIPFWITGPVLTILLLINMSVMMGAFKVKGQTETMEIWLNQRLDDTDETVGVQESQWIGDQLTDEFPLLGCYLNLFDLSGHTTNELPQVFREVINEKMNDVIESRILWSVGFIITAMLIALYFDKGEGRTPKKKSTYRTTSRRHIDDF